MFSFQNSSLSYCQFPFHRHKFSTSFISQDIHLELCPLKAYCIFHSISLSICSKIKFAVIETKQNCIILDFCCWNRGNIRNTSFFLVFLKLFYTENYLLNACIEVNNQYYRVMSSLEKQVIQRTSTFKLNMYYKKNTINYDLTKVIDQESREIGAHNRSMNKALK